MNVTLKQPRPKSAALALSLGLALAGAAIAQTAPTAAQQKELDAARAELQRAAKRYAELNRQFAGDAGFDFDGRVQRRPLLGVLLAPDDASGVRIAGVTPDSGAAQAGLKSGDRITSIDGKSPKATTGTARMQELRDALARLDGKQPVRIGYERDGKPASVSVTPKTDQRVFVFNKADGTLDNLDGNVVIHRLEAPGGIGLDKLGGVPGIAPEIRTEILRLGTDCKGKDCKLPAIVEAFRWNGLNLAAVDAQLGRYFGTSEGVLVLSAGKELDGLQAGDVIRKIDGTPVTTPREAMDALRAKPDGSKATIDYLRDRANATTQISVPKAMSFQLAAPRAPMPPGTPGAVEKRHFVVVDKDGKRQEWEGGAGDTPPAWVQALPKDGKRVEKRVQVIVDDKGNRTIIQDDGLPPPPPAPLPPPPPKVD